MVPTRDGWVRVNPYMTLVASYERLIGARGTEMDDPEPIPEAAVPTSEAGESQSRKAAREEEALQEQTKAPPPSLSGHLGADILPDCRRIDRR